MEESLYPGIPHLWIYFSVGNLMGFFIRHDLPLFEEMTKISGKFTPSPSPIYIYYIYLHKSFISFYLQVCKFHLQNNDFIPCAYFYVSLVCFFIKMTNS